jgi:hypothetical protein
MAYPKVRLELTQDFTEFIVVCKYKWSRTTGIAPFTVFGSASQAVAHTQGGVAESAGIEPATNRL